MPKVLKINGLFKTLKNSFIFSQPQFYKFVTNKILNKSSHNNNKNVKIIKQ